jgi:hypothetical protein
MKTVLLLFLLAAAVSGCAYPMPATTVVKEDRPGIGFEDASSTALLYVDGLDMGHAAQFDGKSQVLSIEPGTHLLQVKDQGAMLFSKKIFVSTGETRIFKIGAKVY